MIARVTFVVEVKTSDTEMTKLAAMRSATDFLGFYVNRSVLNPGFSKDYRIKSSGQMASAFSVGKRSGRMDIKVIYHANCMDGFVAACVAKKFFTESHLDEKVTFYPTNYGEKPPEINPDDIVYILDFSFPRSVMEEMLKIPDISLIILDHHKTARENLANLTDSNEHTIIFDMEKSGAMLAWNFFFSAPAPDLVCYVQDRDLWKWELPYSKEYSAALWSYPMTFENALFKEALEGNALTSYLFKEGSAILRYMSTQVNAICDRATLRRLDNHIVPVCNATTLFSEVGEELINRFGTPFAACWFLRADGKYQYSLRSRSDFDVAAVAKNFGGGGHKNAAGFEVSSRVDI